MNKKYGLFLILGLIVGVDFGIFLVPSMRNSPLVIGLGVLGDVFIVWFIAAAVLENSKNKDIRNDQ